jgi:hypothetical protein
LHLQKNYETLGLDMQNPTIGESNLGALVGAVVGAIGGLFAVGIAPALITGHLARLFAYPKIGLICWLTSGAVGWLIGGQLGPRLGYKFNHTRAEVVGGVLGGLVPVVIIALWGWYMVTPH